MIDDIKFLLEKIIENLRFIEYLETKDSVKLIY